jgi:putative transposase
LSAICSVLGTGRRTAYYVARARPGGRYHRVDDPTVLQQIRAVTNSSANYSYRRVWAMANRTFRAGYNCKRIRRVISCTASCSPRGGTAATAGRIWGGSSKPASDQCWCSDVFLLPCWSGEVISVAFAIDCHDREVFAYIASPQPLTGADIRTLMDSARWARFGETTLKAPHAVQWLSDNGPSTRHGVGAVRARAELGAAYDAGVRPESNGLAEGFVHTFKRDYVSVHDLRDAETMLAQLGQWFDDYNRQAPHSGLGMRPSAEYRASLERTPPSV